jgi:hypothetical protein
MEREGGLDFFYLTTVYSTTLTYVMPSQLSYLTIIEIYN